MITESNIGMQYEDYIRNILRNKNLLPENLRGNDAGFIHKGIYYYVEVKNRTAPDFGQKRLIWNQEDGWHWAIEDIVTEIYDKYDVINYINPKFIPRRHSIPKDDISQDDKRYNQLQFEKSGITFGDLSILYEYYARKECYYIQVEGSGFYYLKRDVADLNVPQFSPVLSLRLRAKTHHSYPIYAYSFFVVIQTTRKPDNSAFDLEEEIGTFPNITP